MLKSHAERAPLKRNIDASEVGDTALFLASDLSAGITGEVIYVDAGYKHHGLLEIEIRIRQNEFQQFMNAKKVYGCCNSCGCFVSVYKHGHS